MLDITFHVMFLYADDSIIDFALYSCNVGRLCHGTLWLGIQYDSCSEPYAIRVTSEKLMCVLQFSAHEAPPVVVNV